MSTLKNEIGISSTLLFIAVAVGVISYSRRSGSDNSKVKNSIKVSELWIYPIKGCAGIMVPTATINSRGLLFDRMYMLVDKNGKFISQRSFPKMALIKTSVYGEYDESVSLWIDADKRSLVISHTAFNENNVIIVDVWGDKCEAYPAASSVNQWFSEVLGEEGLRLVKMRKEFIRSTDMKYAKNGQAAFSDGFPFLLTSNESLNYLNEKLHMPISMARFRPNIVIEGNEPFSEDFFHQLRFHSYNHNDRHVISMVACKPCARCTVPNVDPITGIPDVNKQPMTTMKSFRTGEKIGYLNSKWKGQVFFGQNLDHEGRSGGIISIGDAVEVVSTIPKTNAIYELN
eukprot:gene11586-15519_t